MKNVITKSTEETQKYAEEFGKNVTPGTVMLLYGDLGFGKTTFVQGLAKGIGLSKRIISPTFVIVRKYDLHSVIKHFYHIDLYRITSNSDLETIGIQEILNDKDSVVVIEWPEKLEGVVAGAVKIEFKYLDDNKREINIYE